MAQRTQYYCDWCDIDAPGSGSIGGDWKVVNDPKDNKNLHLCKLCYTAGFEAWEAARSLRYNAPSTNKEEAK